MTTTQDTFERIALPRIRPSSLNPRKSFDEAALAELAASVKEKGVLEPLLVRPSKWEEVSLFSQLDASQKTVKRLEYLLDQAIGHRLRSITCIELLLSYLNETGGARTVELRRIGLTDSECSELVEALQQFEDGTRDKLGFEIAAGERRFRAATLAGLTEVPCIVREMTDKELLEIAVVENEQRADVSPMDKAFGYQKLIDTCGYDADMLAAKIGKSKSYIYGLLKLTQLPPKAAKAMEEGEMAPSVAGLLARIPNAGLREKATKMALEKDFRGERPTYRTVRTRIEQNYMVELKGSPFRQDDATLHTSAGACTTCPHKTGNNRELYPDGRADVCTDPECFRHKVELHMDRVAKAAKEKGEKVLPAAQCEKLFSSYSNDLAYEAPYYDLAMQCHDDRQKKRPRSYKQLVGETLKDEIVLAFDKNGQLHRLVPKEKANAELRKLGILKGSASGASSRGEADWKRRQAEERKKQEIEKEAGRRLMGLVAEDAERQARALLPVNNNSLVELLRIITAGLVDNIWGEHCHAIKKRRGLNQKGERSVRGDDRLAAIVAELDAPELVGLLAEFVAAQKTSHWYMPDKEDREFWTFFGASRKEALAAVKKEKAARSNGHATNGHAGNGKAKKTKTARKCRVCGCTQDNCRQCIEKTGEPCSWVEEDLCSACADQEDAELEEAMNTEED